MQWCKHLYIGDSVQGRKKKIIRKIKASKLQIDAYVIAFPSNDENLLDIYPSYVLLQPHYKRIDITIVGIAYGYEDALLLVQRIVEEVYKKTGNLDIEKYINHREHLAKEK